MKKLFFLSAIFLALQLNTANAQFGKISGAVNKVKKAASNAKGNSSVVDAATGNFLMLYDVMARYDAYNQPKLVNGVLPKKDEYNSADRIIFHPQDDTEFTWMTFMAPNSLKMFAHDGVVAYDMVSGQYMVRHPMDKSQDLVLGTSGQILSRMVEIEPDVFAIYAGAFVSGHPYNVPSYMTEQYVVAMFAPKEKFSEWTPEKVKPIVVAIEEKLKQNYEQAKQADLASLKFPKAGKMNSQSELKNFAKTEIKKILAKDGQQFLTHNIESNDWNIVYDKYTKKPLFRWIKGAFAEKYPNGKCKLQGFLLKQQYNGSGYSNTTFGGVIHGQMPYGQYILCTNVPK